MGESNATPFPGGGTGLLPTSSAAGSVHGTHHPLHPHGPGLSARLAPGSFSGCFGDCPHAHVAPLLFPARGQTSSAVAAAASWVGASGLLQPAAGLRQRDGSPSVPGGWDRADRGAPRGAEPPWDQSQPLQRIEGKREVKAWEIPALGCASLAGSLQWV